MINFTKWIELYEDLYEINPTEENFYCELCNEFPQHAKALNVEAGLALLPSKLAYKYDVTITDSFQEFVQNIGTRQTKTEVQPPMFHIDSADLARYLGKNFFNVIFCVNSRIIFLKEKKAIEKLISDSKALLSDDGYLVFDLINFDKYDLSKKIIELPVRKVHETSLNTNIVRNENNSYKINQQIIKNGDAPIDVVEDESIYPIGCKEFTSIAEELGFSSIQFYSDYNKTPYTKTADKIIVVLKK